jgi:hypothetical protein
MSYYIPVSNGEIVENFSILEIKLAYSKDETKTLNIQKELNQLQQYIDIILNQEELYVLYTKLKNVNSQLWLIEDRIRIKEHHFIFDDEFIELARNVYKLNDERARYKKELNIVSKSELIEEKLYSYES